MFLAGVNCLGQCDPVVLRSVGTLLADKNSLDSHCVQRYICQRFMCIAGKILAWPTFVMEVVYIAKSIAGIRVLEVLHCMRKCTLVIAIPKRGAWTLV